MKIERKDLQIYTDERRFYIDGMTLHWTCPECGEENIQALDSYFFECTDANEYNIYHVACTECCENFKFKGKLNIDFEITDDNLKLI